MRIEWAMNHSTRHRLKKLVLPTLLAAAGACLLLGCIYIPTFGPVVGYDAARKVGGPKSSKPLRVSRATRGEVLRVLGEPHFTSATRRAIAYFWRVQNGYVINTLCASEAYATQSSHMLILRFGEDGVLRKYELRKSGQPFVQVFSGPRPLIPKDLRPEWQAQLDRLNAPATRPAQTRPVER
jgi:hypothetical protein